MLEMFNVHITSTIQCTQMFGHKTETKICTFSSNQCYLSHRKFIRQLLIQFIAIKFIISKSFFLAFITCNFSYRYFKIVSFPKFWSKIFSSKTNYYQMLICLGILPCLFFSLSLRNVKENIVNCGFFVGVTHFCKRKIKQI